MNERIVKLQWSNKTFIMNSFYNKDGKFNQEELFNSFVKHITKFMSERENDEYCK